MKKQTETIAEYKAPKCKLTVLHAQRAILSASNGIDDIDGDNVRDQKENWGF